MTFGAPLFPDLTPKTIHNRPHRVALLGTSCMIVGSPTPQPTRPTPQPPRTARSTQTPHARRTGSRTLCSARSSTSRQHTSRRLNRRFHASPQHQQQPEPEAAERACEEWPAHESPIGRKQNVKGGFHFDTPRDLALLTQAADRAVKESPMTARDRPSKSLLKWLFER